jgi:hypothetical protein
MIVPIDFSQDEENTLNLIRSREAYSREEFMKHQSRLRKEFGELVSGAKIYVLDNYKKVNDYSDLHMILVSGASGEKVHFGKKRADRKKKVKDDSQMSEKMKNFMKTVKPAPVSKRVQEIMDRIDNEIVTIETFDSAVYDWTDGDFSVTINGKDYLWITGDSVIDIADYIETKLKEQDGQD